MSRIKPSVRSKVIDLSVQEFFRQRAKAAYEGRVRVGEVVDAVRHTLNSEWNAKLTEVAEGEVYDWIREYGPEGEDDEGWLRDWYKGQTG